MAKVGLSSYSSRVDFMSTCNKHTAAHHTDADNPNAPKRIKETRKDLHAQSTIHCMFVIDERPKVRPKMRKNEREAT